MTTIDHALVEIALSRVSTQDFEKFVHAFLAALIGPGFRPLGGIHDGGADAFKDMGLYEGMEPNTFS